MSNLLKKIIISFLAFLVIFTSISPNFLLVNAQSASPAPTGTWYNQDFKSWWTKVYDNNISPDSEIFGERYTAAQVQWVIYSLWAFIFNIIVPQNITACAFTSTIDLNACAEEVKQLLGNGQNGSSLATNNQNRNILGAIFASDRPFSGIAYVKERLNKFDLVPEVSAQSGFGFSTALEPVQDLWKAFRDIAFGLFVIVAIVFAFMIMFRVKISPQVVISIQSAIPKIIIALILVTFSYAIAGFLIDIMYIVIGLLSFVLYPLVPTIPIIQPHTYKAVDLFNLFTLGETLGTSGGSIFWLIFYYLTPLMAVLLVLFLASLLATGGLGVIISGFLLFLLAIVILVCLWMTIKTIFALFKALANIILLTIFAPLQLAIGPLIPGFGFGTWIKSYFSNLSVFIVTGVLWFFAWVFSLFVWRNFTSGATLTSATQTTGYWPPLLGTSEFGTSLVFAGVSIVFFTLIPKATEVVQGFISGKPFAYGSAIGESFGLSRTAGGIYAGQALDIIEQQAKLASTTPWGLVSSHGRREQARYLGLRALQSILSGRI